MNNLSHATTMTMRTFHKGISLPNWQPPTSFYSALRTSVGRAAGGGSESGEHGGGVGVGVILRHAQEFGQESERHYGARVLGQILNAGLDEADADSLLRRKANDVTQRPFRLQNT